MAKKDLDWSNLPFGYMKTDKRFVSYFKDTGIMSQTFSNSLVSFTWAAVLFGRMVTAVLAKKMNPKILILTDCIATAVFFILLTVSSNLLLVTISILGLEYHEIK